MKKSELRSIIKEEVKSILQENHHNELNKKIELLKNLEDRIKKFYNKKHGLSL